MKTIILLILVSLPTFLLAQNSKTVIKNTKIGPLACSYYMIVKDSKDTTYYISNEFKDKHMLATGNILLSKKATLKLLKRRLEECIPLVNAFKTNAHYEVSNGYFLKLMEISNYIYLIDYSSVISKECAPEVNANATGTVKTTKTTKITKKQAKKWLEWLDSIDFGKL